MWNVWNWMRRSCDVDVEPGTFNDGKNKMNLESLRYTKTKNKMGLCRTTRALWVQEAVSCHSSGTVEEATCNHATGTIDLAACRKAHQDMKYGTVLDEHLFFCIITLPAW